MTSKHAFLLLPAVILIIIGLTYKAKTSDMNDPCSAIGDCYGRPQPAEHFFFGEEFRGMTSMWIRGRTIHIMGGRNQTAGGGITDGIEHWYRNLDDSKNWQLNELYTVDSGITATFQYQFGSSDPDGPHFMNYTERNTRVAYIERILPEGGSEVVFSFGDDGYHRYNPFGSLSNDSRVIDWFLPDRREHFIRWFQLDADTGELIWRHENFQTTSGARIYDLYRDENDIIHLPVGFRDHSEIWRINPGLRKVEKRTKIDDYTTLGVGNDTGRMFHVLPYPDKGDNGILVIVYLSPAEFSFRRTKGLLGEIVAHSIDMKTHESISRTTIAGFTAEQAATHYLSAARVDDHRFAVAYSTVDDDHYFHRTEKHGNYVEGRIDVFNIEQNGQVNLLHAICKPPFWTPAMAATDDGSLHIVYTEATLDNRNALHYERWQLPRTDND